jgi:hypothetical protein
MRETEWQKRIGLLKFACNASRVILPAVSKHPEMGLRLSIQGFSPAIAAVASDSKKTTESENRKFTSRIFTHLEVSVDCFVELPDLRRMPARVCNWLKAAS